MLREAKVLTEAGIGAAHAAFSGTSSRELEGARLPNGTIQAGKQKSAEETGFANVL
jgi:hypothetical protein